MLLEASSIRAFSLAIFVENEGTWNVAVEVTSICWETKLEMICVSSVRQVILLLYERKEAGLV